MGNIVKSYIAFAKDLFNFKGRTSRRDFWSVYLVNVLIGFLLSIIPVPFVSYAFAVIFLISQIGIMVRRLHDVGKSDFYCILFLIPIVGFILMLVWLTKKGEPGENQYGPNPEEAQQDVPSANEATAFTCRICGATVSETDEFCPECGSRLTEDNYNG